MSARVLLLLSAAAWLLAAAAHAQPSTSTIDRCVDASDRGQASRRQGRLLEAKNDLLRCSQSDCPEPVARNCGSWLAELEHDIPTIVVAATDSQGRALADFRMSVDGKPSEGASGSDLPLDPGAHDLRFEHAGARPVEMHVELAVGEKRRSLAVRFDTAPVSGPPIEPPDGEDSAPAVSPIVWAGVAVTGVGLVIGAVAGGVALGRKSDLADQCATACSQEEIDDGENIAHVSTAGFVLAGVGAVLVVIGVVVSASGDAEPSSTAVELVLDAGGVGARF